MNNVQMVTHHVYCTVTTHTGIMSLSKQQLRRGPCPFCVWCDSPMHAPLITCPLLLLWVLLVRSLRRPAAPAAAGGKGRPGPHLEQRMHVSLGEHNVPM